MSIKVGDRVVYVGDGIHEGSLWIGEVLAIDEGHVRIRMSKEEVWEYCPVDRVFPIEVLEDVKRVMEKRKELWKAWDSSWRLFIELREREGI